MSTSRVPKPKRTAQRLPSIGEVWKGYLELGSYIPEPSDESALRHYVQLARASVNFHDDIPSRSPSELMGNIQYDLALALHGTKPHAAARSFTDALRSLGARTTFEDQYGPIRRRSWLDIITLFSTRTDPSERASRLQQRATVREIGKLMVNTSEATLRAPQGTTRQSNYGGLAVLGVIGASLAHTVNDVTLMATPTTERQRKPRTSTKITHLDAIVGDHTSSSNDLNIFQYHGDEPAVVSATRVQVKANDSIMTDMLYDDDILLLSAQSDLGVDRVEDFHKLGASMAGFYGDPDPILETAGNNIYTALKAHNA